MPVYPNQGKRAKARAMQVETAAKEQLAREEREMISTRIKADHNVLYAPVGVITTDEREELKAWESGFLKQYNRQPTVLEGKEQLLQMRERADYAAWLPIFVEQNKRLPSIEEGQEYLRQKRLEKLKEIDPKSYEFIQAMVKKHKG